MGAGEREVYDTRHFIAIGDSAEEDKESRYTHLAAGFFRALGKSPTKYDLYKNAQYILPLEAQPHTKEYSRETVFPRARVLPEELPKTRWEMFAERKGIRKNRNKRGGRIYDPETRDHAPAYGRGSKSDVDRHWLIEVKENEDPMVDRHSELREDKKGRKARQSQREHKNRKRTKQLTHFEKGARAE